MALSDGDAVFLSASVPRRAGWQEDAQPVEIEEAIVSISRAVFARRGRLLFGGHPSVSPLIAAIAGEYLPPAPERPDRERPVVTFQSEYFRGCLPDETSTMHRLGWASIQWTPAVPPVAAGRGCDRSLPADARERRDSLAVMREWMLLGPATPPSVVEDHGLRPPRLMLAVGGMEGVRDEAALFLGLRSGWEVQAPPRVYAVKTGGGAAAKLVDESGGWSDRLWLGRPPDPIDHERLAAARASGDMAALEGLWQRHRRSPGAEASERPQPLFQPYAAMIQWLLDRA